jgi:hypothetical protein
MGRGLAGGALSLFPVRCTAGTRAGAARDDRLWDGSHGFQRAVRRVDVYGDGGQRPGDPVVHRVDNSAAGSAGCASSRPSRRDRLPGGSSGPAHRTLGLHGRGEDRDPVVRKSVALVAVLAAGVAAHTAAAALNARAPTPSERLRLVQVVRIYVDTSDCCAVIRRIKITRIRVSTVDTRWAEIDLQAWEQNGTDIGAASAVLHRGFLTGKWSVRYFGSDGVVCAAPLRVRRDLKLTCR